MLRWRELTEEARKTIERLVHARSTPVGKLKRAQISWLASQGQYAPAIAQQLEVGADMVRLRLKRFNEQGLAGLEEAPRSGRPATYTPEEVSAVIQTALSKPQELGEDYAMWTLDRLVDHLQRVKGIPMKRSRSSRDLHRRRPQLAPRRDVEGPASRSRLRPKKGGRRNRLHGPSRAQRERVPGPDGTSRRQKLPGPALGGPPSFGEPTGQPRQAR